MKRPENVIVKKTESFADRIVKMCNYLKAKHSGEYDALRQVYRSGTSIGANTAESQYAQSSADFLAKLAIALKEANETRYWLERLNSAGVFTEEEYTSIYNDCIEIIKLLTSITKTVKGKLNG